MPTAAKQQRDDQSDHSIADPIRISRSDAPTSPPPDDRLLRIDEVLEYVHFGKTRFLEMVDSSLFPAPKLIAGRCRAQFWSRNEVLRWIAALPEASVAMRKAQAPLCAKRRHAAASRPANATVAVNQK